MKLSFSPPLLLLLAYVCAGQLIRRFHAGVPVISVAFNPQNTSEFISGHSNGHLVVWNKETGAFVNWTTLTPGPQKPIRTVAYNPQNPTQVAFGCDDGFIRIVNKDTGDVRRTLLHASVFVRSVAYNPTNGSELLGAANYQPILWDTVTGGNLTFSISPPPSSVSSAVNFNRQNLSEIISGSGDGFIRIFHRSGTQLLSTRPLNNWIRSVDFHPTNGSEFLASLADGRVVIMDRNERIVKAFYHPDTGNQDSFHQQAVFNPNNASEIAVGTYTTWNIVFWDTVTGRSRNYTGHSDAIAKLAYNVANRSELVSASVDGSLILWQGPSYPSPVPTTTPTPVPLPVTPTSLPPPSPPAPTQEAPRSGSRGRIIAIAVGAPVAVGGAIGVGLLAKRLSGAGTSAISAATRKQQQSQMELEAEQRGREAIYEAEEGEEEGEEEEPQSETDAGSAQAEQTLSAEEE
eukprot:TRINITY_DN16558_c0_g1_i1.p1 TRINITY_DN16558_c0_g1~~TRINITY_DN16558_c0_g1_i1.p1  ORF type:complete len:460 (+),score=77.14 TRINITY_DN16558_c0_g1_i1:33-1412(+)